jgi:hypothetical protein
MKTSARHLVVAMGWALGTASLTVAGPPGDYGDAPVGDNGQGIMAYPGVVARWATRFAHTNTVFSPQHGHGAWVNPPTTCYLGVIPPVTRVDSAMDPTLPENDCVPVIIFEDPGGVVGVNPLAEIEVTVTTTPVHTPQMPVYLNVWIDQNRDGQWKDGYLVATPLVAWNLEAVVQDMPVVLPAGTTARVNVGPIRLENPLASVWVRVMVTDRPIAGAFRGPAGTPEFFWDSTVNAAHPFAGEIEDHLLHYVPGAMANPAAPGVYRRSQVLGGGGGGGGNPKPACDVRYTGPWVVATPECPPGPAVLVPLGYRSTERNGGCGLNPALWSMYGLRQIVGAPPPVVRLNAVPPGSVRGALTLGCLGAGFALPDPIVGEGPLMASASVPVAGLTAGGVVLDACYPPAKRRRVYRAFFHTYTCGSVHATRTVFGWPATGVTLASAVVAGPGQDAEYCDFEAGGLVESFLDPAEERPFPDPDFLAYEFVLPSPTGSFAGLHFDDFVSPPASLQLRSAGYRVMPAIPEGREAARVSMAHRGSEAVVTLMAEDGVMFTAVLPPTGEWQTWTLDLPADFRLMVLEVFASGSMRIDEVSIGLRLPAAGGVPCDADFNGDGNVDQDDIACLVQMVAGDFSCSERDPDFNGDGNVDQEDVAALQQVVGGAPCP